MPGSRILICKLGAAGDVLRTTPLLEILPQYGVDWLVDPRHMGLIAGSRARVLTSFSQINPQQRYDILFSLEESSSIVEPLTRIVRSEELIGTYTTDSGRIAYTQGSRGWFDMSLISRHGRQVANRLKFENRLTYQQCLFSMTGLQFNGQRYACFGVERRRHNGDVLIAPHAGPRWPNKRWAFFESLAERLSANYKVNWLAQEPSFRSLAETIGAHSVVIANDSLPLHLCLSEMVPVCGLFTCTSPWEIYDYGVLKKIVSARLGEFFYSNEPNIAAVESIDVEEVCAAAIGLLEDHANVARKSTEQRLAR